MTVGISSIDLKKIQQTLLEKQAELSRKLSRTNASELIETGRESDENMQATSRETEERATIGLDWVRDRLKEVEAALNKIADGTFGICEDCNEYIPIKRLEAYPNATLCIECKEKQEKEEGKKK
ncbi:MAG: TraR/DksA family transcriptional regulator [Candidatus Moraniibacteriota bacterium]